MPLLMIEPSPAPLPAETELIVSGGEVGCVRVASGQLLAVTDIEGSQPAGLFALASDDPGHFLSPHHTRVFSNSFMLGLGMRLVTNRRRPAMVLGRDPVGTHDLLMPITEASAHEARGGADQFRAKVAAAFGTAGIAPSKIPDPVNLFLDVAVEANGSLVPRGVASQPGDTVVFRVVMDLMIAVAAPYPDPVLWDREKPGPLALRSATKSPVCDEGWSWYLLRRGGRGSHAVPSRSALLGFGCCSCAARAHRSRRCA